MEFNQYYICSYKMFLLTVQHLHNVYVFVHFSLQMDKLEQIHKIANI